MHCPDADAEHRARSPDASPLLGDERRRDPPLPAGRVARSAARSCARGSGCAKIGEPSSPPPPTGCAARPSRAFGLPVPLQSPADRRGPSPYPETARHTCGSPGNWRRSGPAEAAPEVAAVGRRSLAQRRRRRGRWNHQRLPRCVALPRRATRSARSRHTPSRGSRGSRA